MDGNRRWAREQGLPSVEGHRAGAEKLYDVAEWAYDAGVKELTLYTFSTENWQRSEEEVSYLMQLLEHFFSSELDRLIERGARIRIIGDRSRAPERTQQILQEAEEKTKNGTKGTLIFAFSYGGRAEILAAVNKVLAEGTKEVSEEEFSRALWSAGLSDPDLIIRTGGERRLSGFLTWQSVYSELFFTDTKWPALTKEEFLSILEEFGSRERRRGT